MNWTCLCAPLSFNNNKPILFNMNWNFLFISLRALFSALCPKLLVRAVDRMLTFLTCAGCDLEILDTSGSRISRTEDTKEDRRPKTNRTVNDRVALQKGGNRNGGLHDNS